MHTKLSLTVPLVLLLALGALAVFERPSPAEQLPPKPTADAVSELLAPAHWRVPLDESSWPSYTNTAYGFSFKYPPGSSPYTDPGEDLSSAPQVYFSNLPLRLAVITKRTVSSDATLRAAASLNVGNYIDLFNSLNKDRLFDMFGVSHHSLSTLAGTPTLIRYSYLPSRLILPSGTSYSGGAYVYALASSPNGLKMEIVYTVDTTLGANPIIPILRSFRFDLASSTTEEGN